jgi:hypothetical protein
MDKEEFAELASRPDAPDIMDFKIDRAADAPGDTFSLEAIDELVGNIKLFLLARLVAYGDRTSQRTSEATIRVNLSINGETVIPLEGTFLWWEGTDGVIDGSTRRRSQS